MKQPTLEEVKEYFKNAKEVKCLSDGKVYDISKKLKEEINECAGSFWCMTKKSRKHGGSIELFNQYKYAEILTYKEKTFSITESQIKTLYDIFEVSEAYQGQDYLKEWFPKSEAFENEVKLEVGKWYKFPHYPKFLTCLREDKTRFGIDIYGNWFDDGELIKYEHQKGYKEATEQEVFEALRGEALKRYKVGDWVKSFYHKGNPELCIKELDFNLNAQKGINCSGTNYYLPVVFENGKWAEIIESIILSEAEQQLGKKIIF